MGCKYVIAREGVTPTAGNVLLSLTTGLQEIARVCEIRIGGEASSSTKNRFAVRRSTANGTTPTAQTPAKKSSTSPAAYTDAATTFTGEPTTAAAPAIWTESMDMHGNTIHWISPEDDDDLLVQGATAGNNEISLESSSGTGAGSLEIVFEEV